MSDKKVAIITGASKGIGKAISIGLGGLGYQTILIGRNRKDLQEVSDKIVEGGGLKPKSLALDITNSNLIKETIKDIVSFYGRIDVLVNNAGIYIEGTVEIPETDFIKTIDTNLRAQFVFLSEIVPVMKNQKSGYIFNVASRAGKIGFVGSGAYNASKFGLVGLSESLYRELNPLGISVTALCPGWVNTNMAWDGGTPLSAEEMIQPEDLFLTIEWLLSLSPGACVKEVVLEAPNNIS